MKRIAILGSTGSIGKSALDVIRKQPQEFSVAALSTNSNITELLRQAEEFHPKYVYVNDKNAVSILKSKLNSGTKIFTGDSGLKELFEGKDIEKVLLAISGSAALPALLAAIASGKEVALANKEALVMAGPIIMQLAKRQKVKILPIDSEQSAVWQCLNGENRSRLKKIYLTASGGPFYKSSRSVIKNVSLKQVLRHPRWKMGRKITVDSATLMNKGLEVLEAMFLFAVEVDKIEVLIHPEAVIHSMVEFIDGVVMAQLSATDMRIPIQYAFSYPERLKSPLEGIDFSKLGCLHFEAPNFKKFPCLELAYLAARRQGTTPAVLNAANEVSVEAFLKEKIKFMAIPKIIEQVLSRHKNILKPDLRDILEADSWAREEAVRYL